MLQLFNDNSLPFSVPERKVHYFLSRQAGHKTHMIACQTTDFDVSFLRITSFVQFRNLGRN